MSIPIRMRSWRACGLGLLMAAGLTTLAFAQIGGQGGGVQPAPVTVEYTQQEVQANAMIETLNEMGKQRWDVFQVVPIWKIQDLGGGTEMVPVRYQIFGRRRKVDDK